MPTRSCENCKHHATIEHGRIHICQWEQFFFPPPLVAGRTLVRIFDLSVATDCKQFLSTRKS